MEHAAAFVLFEVLPLPYYRKNHLPGALHMPPTDVAATAERLVADKQTEIIVYCWDEH